MPWHCVIIRCSIDMDFLWLICGSWIDGKSKLSQRMHNLGCALCFFLGPFAFCLNQHWSVLSTVLLVVIYICLIAWLCALEWVERMEFSHSEDDLKAVHKYSKALLLSELLAGMICIVSYVSFVYCLGNNDIL
eukprot:39456_1